DLKAGQYKLKLRVKGDVEGTVKVFLGQYGVGNGHQLTIPVTTSWAEPEVIFDINTPVSGAFCCVQPEDYAGTLEVDWAELSYPEKAPYIHKVDYNNYTADDTFTQASLENGVLVSNPEGWYQFDAAPDNLYLKPNTTYTVTFEMRGSENRTDEKLSVWIGSRKTVNNENINYIASADDKANKLDPKVQIQGYSTSFPEEDEPIKQVITFTTNNDVVDINQSPAAIRFQLAWNDIKDVVEIRKVTIQELNGETIVYDYSNIQHWPFKKGTEYVPALVRDDVIGKTVAKITGSSLSGSDLFRFANGISLVADKYTLKARIKSKEGGTIKLMVGTGEDVPHAYAYPELSVTPSDNYQEISVSLGQLNAADNYWIVYNENDPRMDFSVESFELVSESEHETGNTVTLRNEGNVTYGTDNPNHRSINTVQENGITNSIILSYPLPETRKFIAAVADGKQLEANHTYIVTYNIKSAKEGAVTTLLANYNDLNNAYNNNSSWNAWNTSNAAGTSASIKLQPGVTQTVRTSITPNQNLNPASVVLDLGYNLGAIEVTDLKICDNYDNTIWTHTENSQYVTGQAGTIVNNST
ncbi:MAG: hypothetical protein K2M03_03580, partial [Muribaculaceae bacterium]|nr:hypothetical protein [Muribaculaceae bacterium]